MTRRGPILIVDDDVDMRDALSMVLEDEGYEVVLAEDGRDALDKLEAGLEPRLILLDLMMPRMDGTAFCAERRGDPRLAALPVVLLTADRSAGARASALGVDRVLFKPVDLTDLIDLVASYL